MEGNRVTRKIFLLCLLLQVCAGVHGQSSAQGAADTYPRKPVRILLGSSAGDGIDTVFRGIAEKLTQQFGRSFIVDNRVGAGGTIALQLLADASPDGYTLYGGGGSIITATPLKKVPFDTRRVYAPVVPLTSQPYLLVVNPSLPINSVRDLIEYARARPGTLNFGSTGIGSSSHLGGEIFKYHAKIDIVHVPYKSNTQAMVDLISGRLHMLFTGAVSSLPYTSSGKVRVIAVTSLKRMQINPETPTVSESGLPGFELANSYGLYAPARVPEKIQTVVNQAVSRILQSPDIRNRLASDGTQVADPLSPAEFRKQFIERVDEWEAFFKATKLEVTP
jgi:tripartite-type tricarboxylate transporter receptor subunit TctC